MAIKKSELYSSLWAGCDQLRGSMDASQYKDYVLVLLFMKYVSDKGGALVDIPEGAGFKDMVKLKGTSELGDKINKIIGKLAEANGLKGIIDLADFNDDDKLGKGKEKVDRLSNLIEIFENEAFDFSSNRAENDDLLGDAYEYLMRNFATQSGKSKGQFYTPAEVSRVMAKVIGINKSKSQTDTVYDPTCGSGSLLLKAAAEAQHEVSLYGQENDNATRALAVMNMWLHSYGSAEIVQGNTLTSPAFRDEKTGGLKTFHYAVANPPFSNKNWTNGLDPVNDDFERFNGYESVPPQKNGDFAFLLHLIKSLRSDGKGAIVLPLGVLFRGNSEAAIRKKLVQKGYIKGIIGLPANLFYGTGIAACILVIDKEDAEHRKGIFMIDASKGFIKDGDKNRLRERDIHKIVDTFNNLLNIDKYSRMVPIHEISDPKNDFNLNIPRYIDSQEPEDIQDIEAHLLGGIPERDIEALNEYWQIYPSLKQKLFISSGRKNYSALAVNKDDIRQTIFEHPEFTEFSCRMDNVFASWKKEASSYLMSLEKGAYPKDVINKISEWLLECYNNQPLTDKYAMYQHMMDYWAEIMQDDIYEIRADGWEAGKEVRRIEKKTKKGDKETSKQVPGLEGLAGRLIPADLIIDVYFPDKMAAIDELKAKAEVLLSEMEELREENGGEDGLLANAMDDKQKISKAGLQKALKELGERTDENADEYDILNRYKKLSEEESSIQTRVKTLLNELELLVIKKYPGLTIEEIKTVVVEKKWLKCIEEKIKNEMDNISRRLNQRIKELSERYEYPLADISNKVDEFEIKVDDHFRKMGIIC